MLLEHRTDTGSTWAPPGGHLEFGEEFLDCVKREAKEETGLDVVDAGLWAVNNNVVLPNWHFINFDYLVTDYKGEPKIMELQKCEKSAGLI